MPPRLVMFATRHLREDPGLAFAVLAVVLAIASYAPVIGTGLVGYDDTWLVADNYVVRASSWEAVAAIFFDLESARRFVLSPEYLPIRDLSVMLDVALWGDWYGGHHLTNLACYVAAIALWFGALVRLGIDRKVAGIAVLLWAIHPSHAESVAWLAERKGLLGVMFAGGTALAFARFRGGGRAPWLALAMLLAVAAVWSKAHAAFAIAALAPLDLIAPAPRASVRRSVVGLAGLAVVGGAAFVPVLSLAWSSGVVGGEGAPAGRAAMVLGAHGFYLHLAAMLPENAVSYPISTRGPSTLELVLGGAGFVALATVAVLHRRLPRALLAGCVLWTFGWLPVSHLLVPLDMVIVADRYLLVPSLGFALILAVGITHIPRRGLVAALLGVLCLAGLARTLDARGNWADREALWHQAVRSNPDDPVAWSSYAEAIAARDLALALAVTEEGLTRVRGPRLLLRRALLLLAAGERAQGRVAMREAAEAGETRAMSNLALLLLEDGQVDAALRWARRGAGAVHYEPGQRTLGRVALAARQLDEARLAFERAYAMTPESCTSRYNLAITLIELDARAPRARGLLERCADDPALGPRVRAALAAVAGQDTAGPTRDR